jgi:Septum formation
MAAPAPPGTGPQPEPEESARLDVTAPLQEHAELQEPADDEIAAPERHMSPIIVIVMTVAILAIATGILAVVTHGFHTKTRVIYHVPAVFALRPGDCFDSGPNDVSITPRSCSTPHDAEVFATFHMTGTTWPGDATLQAQAASGCGSRVSGYMSPVLATTALAQEYVYPDSVAWKAGIRTIVCDVRSLSGPLTGSVRKSSLAATASRWSKQYLAIRPAVVAVEDVTEPVPREDQILVRVGGLAGPVRRSCRSRRRRG